MADLRSLTSAAPCFAVLTPTSGGAIATVAVRGSGALLAISHRFRAASGNDLAKLPVGAVAFGRFRLSATAAEEVVIGLPAPDEIEIHCHGGEAVVAAIGEALIEEGCVAVAPALWLRRQEPDPLAEQAILALIQVRTEAAAAILLDQYRGALRAELTTIERQLVQREFNGARQSMDRLLERADIGLHLARPWKVVFAGAPNAGKSSLVNALLGYERSIVLPQPGTTRDVLTATTAIGGWPVELADVAGLRTAGDAIEAEGVDRACRQISAADLVVYLADTTQPWDAKLYARVVRLGGRRYIVAHNKCDLASPPIDGRPAGVAISAKTGQGIDDLCTAIRYSLVPSPPAPGAAVPFTTEHCAALREASAQLADGNDAAAGKRIGSLLHMQSSSAE